MAVNAWPSFRTAPALPQASLTKRTHLLSVAESSLLQARLSGAICRTTDFSTYYIYLPPVTENLSVLSLSFPDIILDQQFNVVDPHFVTSLDFLFIPTFLLWQLSTRCGRIDHIATTM